MFCLKFSFQFFTKSLIILSTFIILFEPVNCGKSKILYTDAYTNAASASELHPLQENPPSVWIGSHTLDFTPNPFLKERKSRSDSMEAESVESSTAESPLITGTTTTRTPTTKQKRKGRKVKGRRRLRKPKSNVTRGNTRVKNQTPVAEESINLESTNEFNGKVELLPIDQVSLNPPVQVKFESFDFKGPKTNADIISITTPDPIRMNYLDPRNNQIPVDFATTHPEKLNPSYFRNIILKAMMDRLVGVGVVTHVPTTLVRHKKS